MENFRTFLKFQRLLKKFNSIYRDLESIHKTRESDNDIEHSYRVAMLCWFLSEEYKLKLDVGLIIKYALVHDFVEVYAGDVSIYSNLSQKNKQKREHKSLLKLKKEFSKLKSVWNLVDQYEKRDDDESRFVYVVEKLEPIFIIILSAQDHFLKRNIQLRDFIDMKQRKIKDIDTIAQIFNKETMAYLVKNKKKYFGG